MTEINTIRFRAWDRIRKEMFSVGNIFINLDGRVYLDSSDERPFNQDGRFAIMQWTRIRDKNGTPIYEDDFVWIDALGAEYMAHVRWSSGGFSYYPVKGATPVRTLSFFLSRVVEVRGNVHEQFDDEVPGGRVG
jgi:hypothetical protein